LNLKILQNCFSIKKQEKSFTTIISKTANKMGSINLWFENPYGVY